MTYEVGLAVGYDDPVYFNKVFRKSHGCAPGAYRVKGRGGGNK